MQKCFCFATSFVPLKKATTWYFSPTHSIKVLCILWFLSLSSKKWLERRAEKIIARPQQHNFAFTKNCTKFFTKSLLWMYGMKMRFFFACFQQAEEKYFLALWIDENCTWGAKDQCYSYKSLSFIEKSWALSRAIK